MARLISIIAHRVCVECGEPAAYIHRTFRWWWFPKDRQLCVDHAFKVDDDEQDEYSEDKNA